MQKAGNVDLLGLGEIQNAKLQGLNSAPNDAAERRFWYDNTNHEPVYHNGTSVVPFGRIYQVFTGADGTNAGSSGLVPIPSATDNTKFLCGDGTFKTPQGTIYTEGTGIDITGTVISADFGDMTQGDVTSALGYTPYNSTNPSGYQANVIETIKVNNTALTPSSKTVNIIVPTQASDINALPNTTKYGAAFVASLNTTDYKLTMTLKDQDGNTLGTSQVVDFPIESVVVSGSYDSTNKKIVLTLQNGNTVDVPVGDLIAGLQTEITSSNKLDADLVDDSTSSHKLVSASDKNTWNNKQDAISDLATIRSGAAKGATSAQKYVTTNPALIVVNGICTWTVTHNLGGDVQVQVFKTSTKKLIGVNDVTLTSDNVCTIELLSSSDIAAGDLKVVVIG